MAKLEREVMIRFRVTPEEKARIEQKMAKLGMTNMAAYMRKMAIDGYILNLDLPVLNECASMLRRCSNSLNQIARRVNATGRLYDNDLEETRQFLEQAWEELRQTIFSLSKIKG